MMRVDFELPLTADIRFQPSGTPASLVVDHPHAVRFVEHRSTWLRENWMIFYPHKTLKASRRRTIREMIARLLR